MQEDEHYSWVKILVEIDKKGALNFFRKDHSSEIGLEGLQSIIYLKTIYYAIQLESFMI